MKHEVEIEALLHWAFRDELPKRITSSAEGIWDRIESGQAGVAQDHHHSAQRYAHFGLPHPDAERLEIAVEALPDVVVAWERQERKSSEFVREGGSFYRPKKGARARSKEASPSVGWSITTGKHHGDARSRC